ncbi:DUF167 family protein [Oceanimonas pelagia]|uniref:UPF0235 protein PU634_01410 n=1 Tax=Oceanimonas pelagia TaxID=3028314 RepID=A0AA50QCF0_9GAMM|nr:DUF167 family protein [Oceanimonas pelagia]WMC11051.1 DUF167 family protein [Oceanimonas pelagia]
MATVTGAVRLHEQQLHLRLYLQPRSSRDAFLGLHGDELRVAITAPPVDGKANAHLLKWLARQCGVAKSRAELVAGHGSRHKKVVIDHPALIPPELAELLGLAS